MKPETKVALLLALDELIVLATAGSSSIEIKNRLDEVKQLLEDDIA